MLWAYFSRCNSRTFTQYSCKNKTIKHEGKLRAAKSPRSYQNGTHVLFFQFDLPITLRGFSRNQFRRLDFWAVLALSSMVNPNTRAFILYTINSQICEEQQLIRFTKASLALNLFFFLLKEESPQSLGTFAHYV